MTENDKELEEYLKGNSALSESYHAQNKLEPKSHVDDLILTAAKNEVQSNKGKSKFKKSPWFNSISIAAMITLSVSLVVTMQEETGQSLINESDIESYDSVSILEESVMSEDIISEDFSDSKDVKLNQSKELRSETPSPATLGVAADYYRANDKAETARADFRERTAKKILSNESVKIEEIRKPAAKNKQALQSVPQTVEIDAAIEMSLGRQFSPEEVELKKVRLLWERGEFAKAKQAYDEFSKNYPDMSLDRRQEILSVDVYNELIAF